MSVAFVESFYLGFLQYSVVSGHYDMPMVLSGPLQGEQKSKSLGVSVGEKGLGVSKLGGSD
jgi:hypothetical protein